MRIFVLLILLTLPGCPATTIAYWSFEAASLVVDILPEPDKEKTLKENENDN